MAGSALDEDHQVRMRDAFTVDFISCGRIFSRCEFTILSKSYSLEILLVFFVTLRKLLNCVYRRDAVAIWGGDELDTRFCDNHFGTKQSFHEMQIANVDA